MLQIDYLVLAIVFITIAMLFIISFYLINKKNKTEINKIEEEFLLKSDFLNKNLELSKINYENRIQALEQNKEELLFQQDLLNQHHHENISNIQEKHKLELSKQEELFLNKEDHFNEKLQLLEESKLQMKHEFEVLANKLFEDKQKKSELGINQIVNNFKGQLDSFNKRVNEVYNDETKQRSSLLNEIKNLKNLNNQISQDAINLTKALKGENKTQGDWGEMILSSILEQSGLREGKEYLTQGSFSNEEGKRLRPDVIVHLPSNKDIIIDSKVSLNAYLAYQETNDVKEQELALKELLSSLKAHIKGLSLKKYEDIKDLRSLDFVLMFIPIEQAFLLATSKEPSLFNMAFEKNIILVSPSTLFATLRTIENLWKIQDQNENALLIATKAGYLYDKFAAFVEELEDIGLNLNRSKKAYDGALNKLSTGKGNLLKRSQDLLDLGVKAKKQINTTKLLDE